MTSVLPLTHSPITHCHKFPNPLPLTRDILYGRPSICDNKFHCLSITLCSNLVRLYCQWDERTQQLNEEAHRNINLLIMSININQAVICNSWNDVLCIYIYIKVCVCARGWRRSDQANTYSSPVWCLVLCIYVRMYMALYFYIITNNSERPFSVRYFGRLRCAVAAQLRQMKTVFSDVLSLVSAITCCCFCCC